MNFRLFLIVSGFFFCIAGFFIRRKLLFHLTLGKTTCWVCLDKERLKNGTFLNEEYFDHLQPLEILL